MKTVLVIGATRGIGRQIARTFSENGYNVCVTGKTTESTDKLPGSIYDVAAEVEQRGGVALPIKCDVRSEKDIQSTVDACIDKFGHIDVAIYNAGAIAWKPVVETPLKQWDLMNQVNTRGTYCMVSHVLPHMLQRKQGKLIINTPPIYNRYFKGKTPSAMTKVAMTVLVHGLANELVGTGVSISALWPASVIESHVTLVKQVPSSYYRKATIYADACLRIAGENSEKLNGQALIDEDYLRAEGVTDFSQYRADPYREPPRMMPKKFPSLLVEEEDESLPPLAKL